MNRLSFTLSLAFVAFLSVSGLRAAESPPLLTVHPHDGFAAVTKYMTPLVSAATTEPCVVDENALTSVLRAEIGSRGIFSPPDTITSVVSPRLAVKVVSVGSDARGCAYAITMAITFPTGAKPDHPGAVNTLVDTEAFGRTTAIMGPKNPGIDLVTTTVSELSRAVFAEYFQAKARYAKDYPQFKTHLPR